MYDQLVESLKEIPNVRFSEYAWKTRPTGNYGTVQVDFEAEDDIGDDIKQDRAYEGSIDLYTSGKGMMIAGAVESVLETFCEGCWSLNSIQYEMNTGLLHREFVFQLEQA